MRESNLRREDAQRTIDNICLQRCLKGLLGGQLVMVLGAITVWFYTGLGKENLLHHYWLIILAVMILLWFTLVRRDITKKDELNPRDMPKHIVFSGLVASWIAGYLYIQFPQVSGLVEVYLGCYSMGALTMGGLAFVHAPWMGVFWVLPFFASCFGRILVDDGWNGLPVAMMLILYCTYIVASLFIYNRRIQSRLAARLQTEEKNEIIKLLLHDFEDNASDWLWESDAQGRMTYLSERVDGKIGVSLEDVRSERMMDVIKRLFPQYEPEDHARMEHLRQLFDQGKAFKDFSYRVFIEGEWRWWVISAKPLYTNGVLQGWRGVGRDITHVRRHAEEIERQANYDALTGIPNRFYLHRLLDEFFASGADRSQLAFVLISIGNFKNVNAIYGQAAGDAVLCETGERLQEFAEKQKAQVARIGGADFAIFIAQTTSIVEGALEILLETLALPVATGNGFLEVTAKAGCVLGSESVTGTDYVLQCAELALVAAKESTTARLVLFDQKMAEHRIWQTSLASELRYAAQNNEYFALYQPQIRVSDGVVAGAEALVRWICPKVGFVSPADFIPLAEKNGQIIDLGNWMLARASQDAMNWPSHIKVAVNASAVQLMQAGFAAQVFEACSHSGLPLERLKIEITESALISDSDKVKKSLRALRDQGVTIALDDFGTGYSSLSYLSKYPVSELKIDQSFVRTMEDNADSVKIVETIVRLARNLRLTTTAEGVETPYQASQLRELGCDYYQGYLYGKPMPHEDLLRMVEKQGKV